MLTDDAIRQHGPSLAVQAGLKRPRDVLAVQAHAPPALNTLLLALANRHTEVPSTRIEA